MDDARPYLRGEDKDKSLHQLQPSSKQDCFVFFACTLQNCTPNPGWDNLDVWERPLVWGLCRYIALDDVIAAASLPAVEATAEAFGIGPHLNTGDWLQLYEFYGELWAAADPLRLQEAWETDTLLEFSKDCLRTRIDSRVYSLQAELDVSRRRVQDRVSQRKATEAPHQAAPPAAETKEKLEEKEQEEEKETAKGGRT
ncbi:hypothetical protein DL769_001003 [Monosporascus sp. CRB-8-3]|nr:hypothetical protein DL769_001003 [Monosporascus sp. CRB-8-3]